MILYYVNYGFVYIIMYIYVTQNVTRSETSNVQALQQHITITMQKIVNAPMALSTSTKIESYVSLLYRCNL